MGGRHDILLRLDRAVWCYILLLVSIIKSAGPQLMSNINKQLGRPINHDFNNVSPLLSGILQFVLVGIRSFSRLPAKHPCQGACCVGVVVRLSEE
ncbi:hypothetical protein J6590_039583 [Homalodisca vitripennis]|nr:hypothetical protein J6590_039583 [Homalodisca vitripennis]